MASRIIPVKTYLRRVTIADTDDGREIAAQIEDLKLLLEAYRTGAVKQDKASDT
jgi:fructose-1,6-bisphosphatase-3